MSQATKEIPGLPERVAPFAPKSGDNGTQTKFLDEFAVEGRGGWVGQLLSGEARFAGSESLERPYEESGWVHTAIKHISSAVRSCPLRFYVEDPKENPAAALIPPNHALNKLFKRPNPFSTFPTFVEAGVLHRKLDGEDFWFMFDEQKNPVKVTESEDGALFDLPDIIIPVRGSQVGLKKGKNGFPEVWEFPTDQSVINFPPGAVVQFKDYDPANPLRGLGDVQVLMRDLILEFGAQRYLESMMRHSGDPGGYIISEDTMTPENERRAEADMNEAFSPDNKGRWRLISGKNVKYEPAKFGPRDMEFKEQLLYVAQKVASVLGVPLPVMGLLAEATYSNFQTAVEQFWRNGNGVLAYLASVEDFINTDFLGRLRNPQSRTFVARFDTSHVEALKDDNAKKLEAAKDLAASNVGVSFEEAALIYGLSGVTTEYGGVAWVPPNITTASEAETNADKNESGGRPEPAAANGQPSPSGGSATEQDDFPGSNDNESGSSGSTGSDGKQAGRPEQRGDDVTAHRTSDGPPDYSTSEARAEYFKVWEAGVLRPGEKAVKTAVSRYLSNYAHAQLKRVEAYAKEGDPGIGTAKAGNEITPAQVLQDEELLNILLLAQGEWAEKLAAKIKVPLERVLQSASETIAAELSAEVIGPSDPWALDYLRGQRIRLSEGVNSTLARDVKRALVEVFRAHPFDMATLQEHVRRLLPELQGALRKVFANRTARANAIARTEVNRAANGTRYETMRRENVEEHQWVTSGDAQVRDRAPHSHRVLDGVIASVGDSFRESLTLRFPLDPDGAPEDVINCRCVTRPIVKD